MKRRLSKRLLSRGWFVFFFFKASENRALQGVGLQALIRLPGRLVSWKPGVNSDGAFFIFWRAEIKCRWQGGGGGRGGEGLSCGDGESEGNMRSVNSHLPGMTAEGCLSKESSTAVSVEETYGGVGAGGSDKPVEAVGFHVGGWQVEATESVARSLLQRVLSSGLFRLFSS